MTKLLNHLEESFHYLLPSGSSNYWFRSVKKQIKKSNENGTFSIFYEFSARTSSQDALQPCRQHCSSLAPAAQQTKRRQKKEARKSCMLTIQRTGGLSNKSCECRQLPQQGCSLNEQNVSGRAYGDYKPDMPVIPTSIQAKIFLYQIREIPQRYKEVVPRFGLVQITSRIIKIIPYQESPL